MKRIAYIFIAAAFITQAVMAANEITASIALKATKGYVSVERAVNTTHNLTNTAPNVAGYTQRMLTNAAAVVTLGNVATAGWGWFRNCGTNSHKIAIGVVDASTNFIEFARLYQGEYGLIPIGTNAIYAVSIGTNETGTVLEKIILDR